MTKSKDAFSGTNKLSFLIEDINGRPEGYSHDNPRIYKGYMEGTGADGVSIPLYSENPQMVVSSMTETEIDARLKQELDVAQKKPRANRVDNVRKNPESKAAWGQTISATFPKGYGLINNQGELVEIVKEPVQKQVERPYTLRVEPKITQGSLRVVNLDKSVSSKGDAAGSEIAQQKRRALCNLDKKMFEAAGNDWKELSDQEQKLHMVRIMADLDQTEQYQLDTLYKDLSTNSGAIDNILRDLNAWGNIGRSPDPKGSPSR